MRIDVRKLVFMGSNEALDVFFERAQRIGCFQFSSAKKKRVRAMPKNIEDLKLAIKELKKQPVIEAQAAVSFHEITNLIDRILILKREIANVHEEIRHVKAEIIKMHPLGHFELSDLRELEDETKRSFKFFFVRHDRFTKNQIPKELIFINREYDFDYYLLVSNEPFHKSGFIEIPIHRSLTELERELARLNQVSKESEAELKGLAEYQECLEDFYIHEMNSLNLAFTKKDVDFCLNNAVFVIEAWVPTNRIKQLDRLTKELPVTYKEVAPNKGEQAPTHLENKGLGEVGQDLVEIYDTPSNSEGDPSNWVVWFFGIFFGMIISDAGYGLIFLLFSLFMWTKYKKMKNPLGKRLVKLMTLLSCVSIIWGVMIASYFSIKLEPNGSLNRFSVLHTLAVKKIDYHIQAKDKIFDEWLHKFPTLSNTLDAEAFIAVSEKNKAGVEKYVIMDQMYDSLLMEIALLMGVIHLSLSFGRNLRKHWSGAGWILALFGGYLFFSTIVSAVPMPLYLGLMTMKTMTIVGKQLLYVGLGLAVVLGVLQDKWGGLAQIFKVIEVFADTLSYLRLYALGLASMVLAATFNEMGLSAGYVAGAFIILAGHIVNIILGVAAGVIHGLRLNLLEWYHHCFEGGGKKFNPLRLIIRW